MVQSIALGPNHHPHFEAAYTNTFFTRTLFTDDAIRAFLTLYRPGKGHAREVDETIIFTGSAPIHDTPQAGKYEVEVKRQQAKEDIAYDPADPGAAEAIILVSIGSDTDGGVRRLHGGVTASLLDQAMGTLLSYYYENTSATSELNVKYKKAIATPCVLKIRAKLRREKGRWIETWGSVEDGHGEVFAEGRGTFVLPRLGNANM
jgi:acyl-coenzyme A thioesterase PaaI-like protein